MEIIYRKISDLKKLPSNPRTIKKSDLERLKQSIQDNPDYFEARPIILSDRTGELVIIAGNQRYEAAKQLGLEEVPTSLLPGLTEECEKEIIIRDNVSNGDWDFDELQNWNSDELSSWGVDVPNEKSSSDAEKPEVEFSQFLDEESNYVVLKFNTDIDWINAQSKLDIKPVKCFSTRTDGKIKANGYHIGTGHVLDGAEVLRRIPD